MPRIARVQTPLLFLVLALPTTARPQSITRRDSAGTKIVETKTPVWGTTARWTVDPKPMVTIGEADGADPYLFSRIMGAVRRKDGSVVVADGSTRELRTFDATGKFIAAKGRKGQGPAEFGSIERIARCGADEIWMDARNRISVWSLNLEYRREFVVTDNIMWPLACFGGTGLLVKQDMGNTADFGGNQTHPDNVMFVDSLSLMILDSLGKDRHDLRKIQLYTRLQVVQGRNHIDMTHPFGTVTVIAAAGRDVMIGSGDRLEVRTYTRSGQLARIARGPAEDLTLTSAMRRNYLSAALTGREKQDRDWLGLAGNPMPKTIPAYTTLLADSDGNTWAKRFSIPGDSTSRWGIFSKEGEFLGHMLLPKGLKVFEIGIDYVLGTVQDSLQVEKVRMYRLHH